MRGLLVFVYGKMNAALFAALFVDLLDRQHYKLHAWLHVSNYTGWVVWCINDGNEKTFCVKEKIF